MEIVWFKRNIRKPSFTLFVAMQHRAEDPRVCHARLKHKLADRLTVL